MNYHLIMDDNFSVLLEKAYDLHKCGSLEEAKFLYEKLYMLDSSNNELLNLYAQLNTSIQNYDFALELFEKLYNLTGLDSTKINIAKVFSLKGDNLSAIDILLELNSSNKEVLTLLSNCYIKLDMFDKAKDILNQLIKIDNNFSNNYNLAICYRAENNFSKAIEVLLPFEEEKSDNIQYLTLIASLYRQLNKRENELFYLQKIGLLTNNTSVLNACALIANDLEKYDLALFYLNKILDISPNHLSTMIFIAKIYQRIDLNVAFDLFKELHFNNPENVDILISLCSISIDLLLFSDLDIYAEKLSALTVLPNNAFPTLANSFYKLCKYEKSLKYWKLSINAYPDNETFKVEYAEVLSILGFIDEARNITKNLLHIPNAKRTYAETYIRNKEFEPVRDLFIEFYEKPRTIQKLLSKGKFEYYKQNFSSKYNISENEFREIGKSVFDKNIAFNNQIEEKRLKNNNYKGKKLLIYSGQGIGDILMNLRYLNFLKEDSDNITLSVPASVFDIVKYNFPMFKDIRKDMVNSVKEFDYVTTYIVLLYNLNLDLQNIPYSDGYLKIDKKLIEEKSKLDLFKTNKNKIGIFWQGNPTLFFNRSAKLKHFIPLLNNSNNQLYSFQLEDIDEESKVLLETSNIINLAPFIKNYTDTASLLHNIDVLITIDSSIAHLAGALGIKTYLMLPYDSEWRWFYDTKTTPWYDSVTIFKQTIPNDWDSVILRISEELNNGNKI